MKRWLNILFFTSTLFYSQVDDIITSSVNENIGTTRKIVIDGGKPTFIILNTGGIIDLDEYYIREKNELEKNFKELNPNVILEVANVLVFKNKNAKKLTFHSNGDSKVIFWDGKVDSQPIVFDGLMKSTEYFSELFGNPKTSLYITDFYEQREKSLKIWENNITKNTYALSEKYVENLLLEFLYFMEKGSANFFNLETKGLKSITAKALNHDMKEYERTVFFDKEGNVKELTTFGEKNLKFIYHNKLLTKIENLNNSIFYDDNKMKVVSDDSTIYTLKNGFLLSKYVAYFDDNYSNYWRDVSYDGKKMNFTEKGGSNNVEYYLNADDDKRLPIKIYFHAQKSTHIMEKINDYVIRIMNVNNSKEDMAMYYFNSKNQIEKFTYTKDNDEKIVNGMEYVYEYY